MENTPRLVILECGFVKTKILEKAIQASPLLDDSDPPILKKEQKILSIIHKVGGQAEGPFPTAKIVERAIRSKKPHHRYLSGTHANTTYLFSFLPSWVTDVTVTSGTELTGKFMKTE